MNKRNIIITILSVLILVCIFAFARTTTTDLGLVKPTWEEESPEYDILVDFNANIDILETFANAPLLYDTEERVEDRAGAMWTGNTETLITLTYQDGDNTVDAVVEDDLDLYDNTTSAFITATLTENEVEAYIFDADAETILGNWVNIAYPWADNEVADNITINLATLATTFTATDNEDEALACPLVFVDGATGAQGAETDGDLTYNPSTGKITATGFVGALTGNADTVTSFTPASGSLTLSGADALTLTTTAATNVTLPTTGTLATLSEAEVLSNKNLTDIDILNFADATELIIATGAITITQTYHKIDTEGDAASDDLATISGGTAGDVIYLCAENDARTVVLKHDDTAGAGKILTSDGNDYSLDDDNKVVTFVYNSVDSHWHMVGAAGGAGETNTASNIGSQVEIFKQKDGVDLEFRTLKAESNKIKVSSISAGGLKEEVSASGNTYSIHAGTYGGAYWVASSDYVIDYVQVLLYKVGSPGIITCYIYAADVLGKPTGDSLGSAGTDCDGITTGSGGEDVTFDLSSSNINITLGQNYCFYLTNTGGDTSNRVKGLRSDSSVEADTEHIGTINSGVDWDVYADSDADFKIYAQTSNFEYINFDVNEENILLDNLGSPEDNTDNNASTSAHGLMPKLPFSGDLLSTTTVAFNADADTTLYTVPTGKRCVLSHAIVVAAGDAGATTTLSIGANGAETDFIPANTLSNLDAQYDSVILQPIPNTTPLKIKSYAAATVIEAQVASQSGVAGNTIYLFGITY